MCIEEIDNFFFIFLARITAQEGSYRRRNKQIIIYAHQN